jgi:hypothetical protein
MSAPAAPSREVRFLYPGVSIRVACDVPGHLAWLQEFLCPEFAVAPPGPADHTVTLDVDTGRYLELWRRGPDPTGATIDGFALDTGNVRLPLWRSGPAEIVAFEREYRVFYVVSPDRREVRLVAPAAGMTMRNSLMRTVRELAMLATERAGGLIVHGAAAVVDGSGLVLAGPKKSGKTTLLVHLLSRGAQFVANDRVVVTVDAVPPAMRGLPTIVAVRAGTARRFPAFEDRLRARGFHAWWRIADRPALRSRHAPPPSVWPLSPAQLVALLGVRRTATAAISAIVFPRVTGLPGGIELRRLASSDAAAVLPRALFRAHAGPVRGERLLALGEPPPGPAARDALCAQLAGRVACFDCALGRDAYAAADWPAAFGDPVAR